MHFVLISALWFLGAVAPFTERGKTDFDTFLQLLNPYGVWRQVDGKQWEFFPIEGNRFIPMGAGTWVYTDFGWYWQGNDPFSWVTDHYGYWKLGPDGLWGWVPDPLWQASKVDFRMTKTHIGWRSSAINQFGEFVEKDEAQRFAKPEEWVFVSKEKFKGPITPADLVIGPEAAKLLEDSSPCTHTFVSWREMDRLGPDPVDYLPKNRIRREEEVKEGEAKIIVSVIWSLPSFWAVPPPDAKPGDIYAYRPTLAQDNDGLQRRVLIWERPEEWVKANEKVHEVLNPDTSPTTHPPAASTPPTVATPPPAPAPAPLSSTPVSEQTTPASSPSPASPENNPWRSKK